MKTFCEILRWASWPLLGALVLSTGAWIVDSLLTWWEDSEPMPQVGHVDRAGRYVHPSGRTVPNPESLTEDVQPVSR